MADKTASQTQQIFQQGADYLESARGEWTKLEQKSFKQAQKAIEELARLGQASLAYAAQISAEWRRMSLEAGKRATELFNQAPRA